MLELALLGLLKERPMHGYDLRKRLREDFGAHAHLSFGSLYPALARLESNGAITSAIAEDHFELDVPLTGSLGGERAATLARRATQKAALALVGHKTRARKVYEITEKGQALFEQLLAVPDVAEDDARNFSVRLAFARHLAPAARVRLLEQRRAKLNDSLAQSRRSYAARERELDAYGRAIAQHANDSLRAEIDWVEALLSTELAPTTPQRRSSNSLKRTNNEGLSASLGAKAR